MATSQLGLQFTTSFAAPAAFLAWNWFEAYCVLSSRTLKQWYGIDHNGNPRQDLAKYGDVAIKEGKITKSKIEQIQRMEAASANSVDGYTLFAASGRFYCCFRHFLQTKRTSFVRTCIKRSRVISYRCLHDIHGRKACLWSRLCAC